MTRPDAGKARLLAALRTPVPAMRKKLRELKTRARARAESPTFVWDSLVQSFATMGNSRGWAGLVENEENARRVSYSVGGRYSPAKRLAHFDRVLRDAVVGMPAQKASLLVVNFHRIEGIGGLAKAN